MKTRSKSRGFALLAAVLLVTSLATAAETTVATIQGVGRGSGDTPAECCAHLSALHNSPGNMSQMQQACFGVGGNVIKNVRPGGGYCESRQQNGGGYRYQCSAPMVGDCVKWQ